MLDLQELKRKAEVVGTHNEWTLERVDRLKEFRELATPAAILSLIAEVESLRKQLEAKDADIERAIRLTIDLCRDNWAVEQFFVSEEDIVADALAQVKEQGK